MNKNEKVRDGYFQDLPEDIQKKIMNIHRLIVDTAYETLKDHNYTDLKNDKWAKNCLDEFLLEPTPNDDVGSVRVYQKGKRYRCMIQLTGHFANHMNDFNQELMHDFIKNIFVTIRPIIRRKYDCTIANEGDHGQPFEGFDLFTKPKVAEEIWNKFEDFKTRAIKESEEIESLDEEVTVDDIDLGLYIESLDYNDTDDIIEFIEDVIMEKKTQTQYRIDAFKKRFNFVPEKKDMDGHNDPNRGTITINGKQVKVDLGNSKWIPGVGSRAYASAITGSDNPDWLDSIILDQNDFFKLKNKDQDAVINHELGHLRMHNKREDSQVANDKFFDKDMILNKARNMALSKLLSSNRDIDYSITRDNLIHTLDDIISKDPEIQNLLNKKNDDQLMNKLRNIALKVANNYLKNHMGNSHLSTKEAEADAYAKQHGHDMKKALYHVYKSSMRPLKAQKDRIDASVRNEKKFDRRMFGDDSDVKNPLKELNKANTEDYLVRKRMLADKRIGGNPIYKESVDVSNLMSEKQVIGTIAGMNIGEMNQSKANTIANLITKNMLPRWAPSFNKFTIVVDTKSEGSIVEFKVPKMTQDFISRFLENRETIDGFLHRSPEIKIRITAKAFSTVKEPANILHFMKAAIKYYDSKINGYANKLMIETRKLGHEMNHLISTTKLSGLVSFPLSLLFVFDKVDMTNKDTFNLSASDTEAINAFIHNIHSRYPAPEKEKKEIINALQIMISHLRESVNFDENYDDLIHLSSEVEKYLSEGYKNEIEVSDIIWISENVDNEWTYHQEDPQIKALIEANHVKKLKKIPRDLVAYIQIETESIEDANDKMLIASYCIDKLEIVEWYIELLEVGSEKYIVPDSLSYLRTVRTQLIQCYKNIMAVKVTPKSQRPLYDINVLPAGYRD